MAMLASLLFNFIQNLILVLFYYICETILLLFFLFLVGDSWGMWKDGWLGASLHVISKCNTEIVGGIISRVLCPQLFISRNVCYFEQKSEQGD